MKLTIEALPQALQGELATLYWVCGDEPWQHIHACDSIRHAAQQAGFVERQVFHAQERHFAWSELATALANMSLFSARRLIELRWSSGRIPAVGQDLLRTQAKRSTKDCLLLVSSGRLGSDQRTNWFRSLEKEAVIIPFWPLEGGRWIAWLRQRLRQQKLTAEDAAIQLLALRNAGNVTAAAQEIERLALLYSPGRLSAEQIEEGRSAARYHLFDLIDALLSGQGKTALTMLNQQQLCRQEPPLVLWALAYSIRCALAHEQVRGPRQRLAKEAGKRLSKARWRGLLWHCAELDKRLKNNSIYPAWDNLRQTARSIASDGRESI